MIVDSKGVIRAFSYQPQAVAYVGRNVSEYVDQKNRHALKMLVDLATAESKGWVSSFKLNSLERMYGVKVASEKEVFVVIAFGYFPYQHNEITQILVSDTFVYLKSIKSASDLNILTNMTSPFIKGQIFMKLFDVQGHCWLWGYKKEDVWSMMESLPKCQKVGSMTNVVVIPKDFFLKKLKSKCFQL